MADLRGSWYSQLPSFGWFDREDRPGSNALGVPDSQQGIALPTRSTLGKWFNVTAPNGQTLRLQHTDIGPAAWTGRGVDISAAAGQQFGYSPKTFPTDASFTVEPADGGPMPSQGQRKMAGGSLIDMMQNMQPQDAIGRPASWGDALASRSGSLIGLGMGLLQPYRPWAGESPFANALRGYQVGAAGDESSAKDTRDFAFKQQQAKLAQSNFERTATRLEQSPAEQMLADLKKYAGTPQEQEVKNFYAKQIGGQWSLQDVAVDAWNRPVKKWVNNITQEVRDIDSPPSGVAGGAAFGAGGGVPYAGTGPMGTSAQGPAPGGGATFGGAGGSTNRNAPPMVQLPDGRVISIPPGMDAKTFSQHVSQNAADAAAGKFSEDQSKSSMFAGRMAASKPILDKLDTQGTNVWGGGVERMPGSDKFLYGNYLVSPEYREFRQARDGFINALLRRESGAAIHDAEYTRIEREMFPQPGDNDKVIANKRALRDAALNAMVRSAGPAWQPPPPPRQQAPPDASTAQGAAKVPTYNLQTGKFE